MSRRRVDECPTPEELLQVAVGDLAADDLRVIDAHLSRCSPCLAEFREADARALAEYLAQAEEDPAANQTSPEEVARFRRRLHEYEQASIHRRPFWSPRTWLPPTLAIAFGIVPLAVATWVSWRPAIEPDDLLERATAAERSDSRAADAERRQRVRVNWTPAADPATAQTPVVSAPAPAFVPPPAFVVVRELTAGVTADAWPSGAMPKDDAAAALPRLLAEHHVDWRRPLSAVAFAGWRRGLPAKRDRVSEDGSLVMLRTQTTDSRLRYAELVVRRDTFRVVRQTFVFEGIGRLEIDDVTRENRGGGAGLHATAPAAVTRPADGRMPERDLLQRSELDARIALRQAGLDLGSQLRVSSTREAVRVEGVLASAAQHRAMSARLGVLPHVSMAVRVGVPPAEPAAVPSRVVPTPGLSQWLDRTLAAGSGERAKFVPETSRLASTIHQRLTALHRLSQRYSAAEVRQLSPAAHLKLQRLLDLHYHGLSSDLEALDTHLAVLLGSTTMERPAARRTAPSDWARRAEMGAALAAPLRERLYHLLARTDVLPTADRVADERGLQPAFDALWRALHDDSWSASAPR